MLEEPARAIGVDAQDWVIGGGEDHSLLATFDAGAVIPRSFKPIGTVIEGEGVYLDDQKLAEAGWDSLTG
jgi:thiamine-monophosphate kinase